VIVIGADTDKRSHTCAGVEAASGQVVGDRSVMAARRSFDDLLRWARRLDSERVWAIEDCRRVSGAVERLLLGRGERVVGVAPLRIAGARASARERGTSDRGRGRGRGRGAARRR
jgi:transposase